MQSTIYDLLSTNIICDTLYTICYAMLCYAMLFYAILYYTIL